MLDAKECHEHAASCRKKAAETTDPVEKQRLSDTAYGWARVATDLEKLEAKLAQEQQTQREGASALQVRSNAPVSFHRRVA
jgi:hypothetical protein